MTRSTSPVLWALGALPIVVLLAAAARSRLRTERAAALVLLIAAVVAVTAFGAGPSALVTALAKGAWLGLWILLVVGPGLLLYRIAEAGGVDQIGVALAALLPKEEEMILLLAWVLPSFVQGVAGFGTPIALAAPLLLATGLSPARAVMYPLIGYHWSVTFGSMGSSFYMAALTAHLDRPDQATFAAQASMLLTVNLLLAGGLVLLLHGGLQSLRRGSQMLLTVGGAMAATLVVTARAVPAIASLSAGAVGLLATSALIVARRRTAVRVASAPTEPADASDRLRTLMVLAPYAILLIAALPLFLIPALRAWGQGHLAIAPAFASTRTSLGWVNAANEAYSPIALLAHPGTFVLFACVSGVVLYRRMGCWQPSTGRQVLRAWATALPRSALTIVSLTCMALVMVDAGMVSVLARGTAAVTGPTFPLLSPLVGAAGSFMTGSTTTSNALLAALQADAGRHLDIAPTLLLAAQTAGGNVGNAISPVVVVIGATAVGDLALVPVVLRGLAGSIGLLLIVLAVLTALRTGVS